MSGYLRVMSGNFLMHTQINNVKYQVVKVSPGGSLPSLPLPRTAVDMSADSRGRGRGHVQGPVQD